MELSQLRYFLASQRHLSFVKAADELHATRQAVSASIRNLELELGICLFERKHNLLRLTEEGERFAVQAGRVIDMVDSLYQEKWALRKELILGVDSFIIGTMTDPFDSLSDWSSSEQGCPVRVMQDSFHGMLSMLMNGERDLLILRTTSAAFNDCKMVPLRVAVAGLIVNANDPLACMDVVDPSSLANRTLVVPNGFQDRYRNLYEILSRNGEIKFNIECIDSPALAHKAIVKTDSIGITEFEGPLQRAEVDDCVKLPITGEKVLVRDCLLYQEDSQRKDQIANFAAWLSEAVRYLSWCPTLSQ